MASAAPAPHSATSVVILTYNSQDDIIPCLRALMADNSPDKETLVIDNASRDRTVEVVRRTFPGVRLVENPTNVGVAAGWNQGARLTTGDWLVFLNPDVEVSPNWLAAIHDALARYPLADVAGIKLLYPDGRIQHGGLFFHPNAQSFHRGAREEDHGQVDMVEPIGAVTGAVLVVRRSALLAHGGFDEDYFPAYFEEADLCYRVAASGRQVLYVGASHAIHHEASSLGATSDAYARLYFRMRALYILKNYSLRHILQHSIPAELHMWRQWPWQHRKYALLSWFWSLPFAIRRLINKARGLPGRPYGRRARRQAELLNTST